MKIPAKKLIASDNPLIICLITPVALWGLWAWEAGTKKAPTSPGQAADQGWENHLLLWMALAATVVMPVVSWLRFRYMSRMLADAVTVVGTVTSVGRIQSQGWMKLGCGYEVEGRRYENAVSIHGAGASRYMEGGPIELLVPQSHPSRSYIKSEYA